MISPFARKVSQGYRNRGRRVCVFAKDRRKAHARVSSIVLNLSAPVPGPLQAEQAELTQYLRRQYNVYESIVPPTYRLSLMEPLLKMAELVDKAKAPPFFFPKICLFLDIPLIKEMGFTLKIQMTAIAFTWCSILSTDNPMVHLVTIPEESMRTSVCTALGFFMHKEGKLVREEFIHEMGSAIKAHMRAAIQKVESRIAAHPRRGQLK